MARSCSSVVGSRGCLIQCPGSNRLPFYAPPSGSSTEYSGASAYSDCCRGIAAQRCGKDVGSGEMMGLTMGGSTIATPPPLGGRKPVRTGEMVFRGADGKLLEGKQEILGVELPKILIVAGVAVAAYFIVKKMK
jgi:hypothetical protein